MSLTRLAVIIFLLKVGECAETKVQVTCSGSKPSEVIIPNPLVPYVQIGRTGTLRDRFVPIPSSIGHKITSIELNNLVIDPDELLQSLQNTPIITSINMTNIQLTKPFSSKVFLPFLTTFILDISSFTPTSIEHYHSISHLIHFTGFHEKCLFFQHGTKFEQIPSLGIHVQLTFKEHKLINIDRTKGEIILNQIPFTSLIVQHVQFPLQSLALKECYVNITDLLSMRLATSLVSLNLHLVEYYGNDGLSTLVQNTPRLEELIVNIDTRGLHSSNLEINRNRTQLYLSNLPTTLKHLSINSDLNYNEGSILPNMHTFYCDSCQMHPKIKQDFGKIFPNLNHFGIKTVDVVDLKQLVKGLNGLESVYIASSSKEALFSLLNNSMDSRIENSQFESLQKALTELINGKIGNGSTNQEGYEVFVEKSNINGSRAFNPKFTMKGSNNYQFNKLNDFYTSFEEMLVEERLEAYELAAVHTSNYVYEGQLAPVGHPEEWPASLKLFDSNITNFTTITVRYVKVRAKNLQTILHRCTNLKSIHLSSVGLYGSFRHKMFAHLDLNEVKFGFSDVEEFDLADGQIYIGTLNKSQLSSLIPFKTSGSLLPIKEDGRNKIQSFALGTTESIYFKYSFHEQELRLCQIDFVNEFLTSWEPFIDFIITKLTIISCTMNGDLIPVTVERLILNRVSLDPNTTTSSRNGFLWSKFKSILHLAVNEVKMQKDENFIQVDVSQIMMMHKLEHLTIESARLTLSNQTLTPLKLIKTLHLNKCTFDMDLLESMWKIFPVSKVTILMETEINRSNDPIYIQAWKDYEVALLSALKNEQIRLIRGIVHGSWTQDNASTLSKEVKGIKQMLSNSGTWARLAEEHTFSAVFGIPETEFVIERRPSDGVWVYADLEEI